MSRPDDPRDGEKDARRDADRFSAGAGASAAHPARAAFLAPPPLPGLQPLKERLLIPDLWLRLGLPGQPGATCRSPFRRDRSPSFSIYEGGRRWKDHATGEGGDAIAFLAHACQVDEAEAVRRFRAVAGEPLPLPPGPGKGGSRDRRRLTPLHPQEPPAALRPGTQAELQAVARSRGLSVEAVALAQSLRTLAFGRVCGHACWVLGDDSGLVREARRLDGLPFPARGGLGERKAHTLRGSRKDWPCGAAVLRRYPAFRTLLVVEGGPDYLAALHFALGCGVWDALPVAMLGRSTGGLIAPEALALMAGRRVRLYPHADADGGGLLAARRWASQLHAAGCPCDFFDFRPLQQAGGHAVKDLNDAVLALSHPDNPCNQTSQNIIP